MGARAWFCAVPWLAASLSAAPVIHCEKTAVAFGERLIDQPVIETFVLENRGDEDLVISELKPGCPSCTKSAVDRSTIPPGEKANLRFHLELGGFRGLIRKNVYVFSNDPKTPRLELSLTGTAMSEIMVSPDVLSFAAIPEGGFVTGRVEVVCTSTNRLVVTRAVADQSFLKATITPLEVGHRYAVEVVVRGDAPAPKPGPVKPGSGALAARLEGNIILYFDHPTQEALPLPVRGFLRQRLYFSPPVIPLAPNMGPGATRALLVSHEERPDFKITAVEWPVGKADFDWAPMGPGRGRLTFRNFSSDPALNGREVIIRSTLPGREEMRVPLRILGASAPSAPSFPTPVPPTP